jgi:hypothetical protein
MNRGLARLFRVVQAAHLQGEAGMWCNPCYGLINLAVSSGLLFNDLTQARLLAAEALISWDSRLVARSRGSAVWQAA